MKRIRIALLALVAVIALTIAAGASARTEGAAAPAKASATKPFRVALVTDIGGLNDRGFNQLANQGLIRAKSKLKVQTRVFISKSPQDYIPNLSTAARTGYNLVIAVGFLMVEPLNTVSKSFPNTKFAIVDGNWEDMKNKPKNVRGLLFKEQEAGYLVGYLAGLQIKRKPVGGQQIVSAVGGLKIPPVDRFIAGFRAGAKKANPKVGVLINYSQDFVDQAKCKEQALNQIANGSGVVFQVAGGCGLGALDAARQEGVFGIGVDADQAYLGPHVLTSALKKVDVSVYSTIQAARDLKAKFRSGYNVVFNTKSRGVGFGKVSPRVNRADIIATLKIQAQIRSGVIKNIPQKV